VAQVSLNDKREYGGGRLVFAVAGRGFVQPSRAPGSASVHDGAIVHGVTEMKNGVRYGLFLLDTQ
jgi:hypothetical protein